MAKDKVAYLVTGEFCARVMINPEDLKEGKYDDAIKQFSDALIEKIRNGEVLENITSIKEDIEMPYEDD